jgi:hypothetical protein
MILYMIIKAEKKKKKREKQDDDPSLWIDCSYIALEMVICLRTILLPVDSWNTTRKKRMKRRKVHCILLLLPWQANAKEMWCAVFRKKKNYVLYTQVTAGNFKIWNWRTYSSEFSKKKKNGTFVSAMYFLFSFWEKTVDILIENQNIVHYIAKDKKN